MQDEEIEKTETGIKVDSENGGVSPPAHQSRRTKLLSYLGPCLIQNVVWVPDVSYIGDGPNAKSLESDLKAAGWEL